MSFRSSRPPRCSPSRRSRPRARGGGKARSRTAFGRSRSTRRIAIRWSPLRICAGRVCEPRASPSVRCQAALALAMTLSIAGRVEEALLDALDALSSARAAQDPRAIRACIAPREALRGRWLSRCGDTLRETAEGASNRFLRGVSRSAVHREGRPALCEGGRAMRFRGACAGLRRGFGCRRERLRLRVRSACRTRRSQD